MILDIRRSPGQGDLDLLHWLRAFEVKTIIVLTKADKLSKIKAKRQLDLISTQLTKEGFAKPILFSAKTGQGRQELWNAIEEIAESA